MKCDLCSGKITVQKEAMIQLNKSINFCSSFADDLKLKKSIVALCFLLFFLKITSLVPSYTNSVSNLQP